MVACCFSLCCSCLVTFCNDKVGEIEYGKILVVAFFVWGMLYEFMMS